MNKPVFLYNAIIRKYLSILAGILLSFLTIIIVFVMLLHIWDIFRYYANVTAGFVPEIMVQFDEAIEEADIRLLISEASATNKSGSFRYGFIRNVESARFRLDSGSGTPERRSLETAITVLGLVYDGDRRIEIVQQGQVFTVEVQLIDYFGEWFIRIEKHPKVQEIGTHVEYGGNNIYFEAIDFGGFHMLVFQHPDDPDQISYLFDFMIDFAGRFVELRNMGISPNRFEADSTVDGEIYNHRVMVQRSLLACFNMVFSDQGPVPASLISEPLYSGISRYTHVQDVILQTEDRAFPLRVVDFFNIHAEKHYNNNIVLMNYSDFSALYDTKGKYNVLLVYGDDLPKENVAGLIRARHPEARITFRHDAIPTLLIQEKIVKYGIYALLGLFFAVVCCIVLVRLLKFYMVFQYDLVFMKIYGYEGAIFSKLLAVILLAGATGAYACVLFLIRMYNRILAHYYYPEISFDPAILGVPLALCAGILLGAYVLERTQIRKLEYGNRGDLT